MRYYLFFGFCFVFKFLNDNLFLKENKKSFGSNCKGINGECNDLAGLKCENESETSFLKKCRYA